MWKFVRPLIIAASTAGLASPASAEEVTVRVSYADLDLASADDVAVLQARLTEALRSACADGLGASDRARRVSEACVASGLANGGKVIAEHKERALAELP